MFLGENDKFCKMFLGENDKFYEMLGFWSIKKPPMGVGGLDGEGWLI